jgi:hypothetical protein
VDAAGGRGQRSGGGGGGGGGRPPPPPPPAAVIEDLDAELVGSAADLDPGARARPGVLERVGQSFLDDAIGGEVDALWQLVRFTFDRQLHRQAGLAHLVDEAVDLAEAGLRPEVFGLALFGSQDAQQAFDIGQRLTSRGLYRGQRVARRSGLLVEDALRGARLQHDHVERVTHDIVKFAR